KLTEAKRFIQTRPERTNSFTLKVWNELLLEIAIKEKDTDTIRTISQAFILSNFNRQYYWILKSTFSKDEWAKEMEMLIAVYQKNSRNWFSSNIGNLLVEEKEEKRLLDYVTRYCSTQT